MKFPRTKPPSQCFKSDFHLPPPLLSEAPTPEGARQLKKQSRLLTIRVAHLLKKAPFFMVASIIALASSCFSPQKTVSPSKVTHLKTTPPQIILAPMPILAQRIQTLENDLKEKKISREDRKTAENILRTYRALQSASSSALTVEDREKLIRALFNSLNLVETKYFEQNRNQAADSPANGNITIREFQLQPRKKETTKPIETVTIVRPPIVIPEKSEETMLKSTQHMPPPNGEEPQGQEAMDLNLLLKEVESLVRIQKYKEAVGLLSEAEKKVGAGPARQIILRTKEHINAENETVPMPENINNRDTQKIEEEAKNLLEQEKFEEAINRLETLENARSVNNEAQLTRLKQNAVNGLINRERNRAANFYLKSKKTNDPALKQEALYASRDILADLILNYPNSSLIPKLTQNLEVVEQALEALQ
jgi:hypothetical protein